MSSHHRAVAIGCISSALGLLGCHDDPASSAGSGGSGAVSGATSTAKTSSDAGTTGSSSTTSSASSGGLDVPQVVDLGGPVLAAPKALAITWSTDPSQSEIDAFVSKIGGSSYWAKTTLEYGVGALHALPPVHLTDTPPATITDQEVVQLLRTNTEGANPAWGPADPNTNYLFVFPVGSIVQLDGPCCGPGFDAYHGEATVGAISVSYSVVCECPGYDGPALDIVQSTTAAISHELVESVTDPFVDSSPAYTQEDDTHAAFTVVTGGEVADMCEYLTDTYVAPSDLGYTVQRSWSNAAASADEDPCVPADPTTAYFESIPELADPVTIDYYGPWTTRGVTIPVGGTKTVAVHLHSHGPTAGPWKVEAQDVGQSGSDLSFSWSKDTGNDGDVLSLTITVNSADPSIMGEPFAIVSSLNGRTSLTYGLVGN